jgi:hypothetical protein
LQGALITHRNLISVYASAKALEITQVRRTRSTPNGHLHAPIVTRRVCVCVVDRLRQLVDDVHMSYLPLPHVFERVVEMGVIGNGAGIGYWQGSPEKLLDDLQVRTTASEGQGPDRAWSWSSMPCLHGCVS